MKGLTDASSFFQFALAAGLSSLGDTRIVVYGGLAGMQNTDRGGKKGGPSDEMGVTIFRTGTISVLFAHLLTNDNVACSTDRFILL